VSSAFCLGVATGWPASECLSAFCRTSRRGDRAELDLAVAEDLADALDPAERLVARLHLEQHHPGDELVHAGVGPVLHGALAVLEGDAGARAARAQAVAVEEGTAGHVLADERAHLLDELAGRKLAGFGVGIVLVHDEEAHVVSPFVWTVQRVVAGTPTSARSRG
jgi:hypothetical protein